MTYKFVKQEFSLKLEIIKPIKYKLLTTLTSFTGFYNQINNNHDVYKRSLQVVFIL